MSSWPVRLASMTGCKTQTQREQFKVPIYRSATHVKDWLAGHMKQLREETLRAQTWHPEAKPFINWVLIHLDMVVGTKFALGVCGGVLALHTSSSLAHNVVGFGQVSTP